MSLEGTKGSTASTLILFNQFNKQTKAVYCWTEKEWTIPEECAETYEFKKLVNFVFPDTVLFIFQDKEIFVIDIATEIKMDYRAYDRYDNSVLPFHSVGGTPDLKIKLSTFLDKNPSNFFEYKGVHEDTGELMLINSYYQEDFLENQLVRSLTRNFTDEIPFVVKREDVSLPRIVYANPESFIEYYISTLKGEETRPRSYSSLYRHFLKN